MLIFMFGYISLLHLFSDILEKIKWWRYLYILWNLFYVSNKHASCCPFRKYPKIFEKVTFFYPPLPLPEPTRICLNQGERSEFFGKVCVRIKWMIFKVNFEDHPFYLRPFLPPQRMPSVDMHNVPAFFVVEWFFNYLV